MFIIVLHNTVKTQKCNQRKLKVLIQKAAANWTSCIQAITYINFKQNSWFVVNQNSTARKIQNGKILIERNGKAVIYSHDFVHQFLNVQNVG